MDQIKEAFQKVRQDIDSLKEEVILLRSGLVETREKIIELCEIIKNLKGSFSSFLPSPLSSTHNPFIQTSSTHNPTLRQEIEGLNPENLGISTGNGGVPTDRQTDRQTDRTQEISLEERKNSLENVSIILDSLDSLKKELRLKFKRLTEQEFLVFSTIYQIEEEHQSVDYKTLAKRLNLSESSIRDYICRIIQKGISIHKTKVNNKAINLSISQNIKKMASLPTILKLREL